jgi:hypothetical protein
MGHDDGFLNAQPLLQHSDWPRLHCARRRCALARQARACGRRGRPQRRRRSLTCISSTADSTRWTRPHAWCPRCGSGTAASPAVGNNLSTQGNPRRIDLRNRTVIPGIVDAHNHIVLVGNRPGWSTPLEHVFTIQDCVAALKTRATAVPAGEMITCIGPLAAMQFPENRLPNLTELDAVPRPVFLQAAQGGTRTNSEGKKWFEARGIMVAADGSVHGPGRRPRAADASQGAAHGRDAEAVGVRCAALLRHARHHDASGRRVRFMPTSRPLESPTRTPTRCTSRFSR